VYGVKMKDQAYFQHHVFFCVNERDDGRACCADRNAKALQEYAKKRLKTSFDIEKSIGYKSK
jgi:hypothetical protein